MTLRTFDLGGDKFSTAFRIPKELNPALGIRAVRLALREREVFRAQLRAMLRAAAWGDVRVMVPMVSTLTGARAARGSSTARGRSSASAETCSATWPSGSWSRPRAR